MIVPGERPPTMDFQSASTSEDSYLTTYANNFAFSVCVMRSQVVSGISANGGENGRENITSRHSGRFAHSEIIRPFAVS